MCDLFLSLINKYTLNQNYMIEQITSVWEKVRAESTTAISLYRST